MFLVGPKTKNTFLHFDTAALERPNLPPRARSASGRLRCATSEVAVAAPFVVVSPPPALVSNMGKADDDGESAFGNSSRCTQLVDLFFYKSKNLSTNPNTFRVERILLGADNECWGKGVNSAFEAHFILFAIEYLRIG